MALDLSSLHKAVTALEQTLERGEDDALLAGLDEVTRNALRAGAIRHFECTYELCWKFMQRWLRVNASPEAAEFPRTRKELFRMAARHALVGDPLPWFEYAEVRNLTAHTCDDDQAARVYAVASRFLGDARGLLRQLDARND